MEIKLNWRWFEIELNWRWFEIELKLNWNGNSIELKLNLNWIETELKFNWNWYWIEYYELKLNWNIICCDMLNSYCRLCINSYIHNIHYSPCRVCEYCVSGTKKDNKVANTYNNTDNYTVLQNDWMKLGLWSIYNSYFFVWNVRFELGDTLSYNLQS